MSPLVSGGGRPLTGPNAAAKAGETVLPWSRESWVEAHCALTIVVLHTPLMVHQAATRALPL